MQAGGGPIQPDPALGHAANFLYMLTGNRPNALSTRAFDIALVLHADHELNASTFAARVAAATLTDLHSAIVAAIGTLKGPLHGGANADVMRLLIDVGQDASAERIDEAIRSRLARKIKIGIRTVYHKESARDSPAPDVERPASAPATHAGSRGRSDRGSSLRAKRSCIPTCILFGIHVLLTGIELISSRDLRRSRVSGWTLLPEQRQQPVDLPRTDYISRPIRRSLSPTEQVVLGIGPGS
jgi:citrate synthase